jgi:hypothetical protein
MIYAKTMAKIKITLYLVGLKAIITIIDSVRLEN